MQFRKESVNRKKYSALNKEKKKHLILTNLLINMFLWAEPFVKKACNKLDKKIYYNRKYKNMIITEKYLYRDKKKCNSKDFL